MRLLALLSLGMFLVMRIYPNWIPTAGHYLGRMTRPVLSNPTGWSSDPDQTDPLDKALSFNLGSNNESNGIFGVGGHITEPNQTDKRNLNPSWSEIDDSLDDMGAF